MRLKDKIILVTGGEGLLGKAIIDRIKADGGICISGDLKFENDLSNGRLSCDVTDEDSVKECINSIVNHYQRIDGLVNTAYPRTSDWSNKFENISLSSWRKNVDMQLNSMFILCQEALEKMKIQQSGSIINLASIYGIVGPDFSVYEGTSLTMPAAYAAIKGGIINFTKYLAAYYGPYQVRVNCISPGGIFDNQNPIFVKRYEQKVPLRKMGSPEQIAGPASFLLSDDAAYITGHNLVIDGGWTII